MTSSEVSEITRGKLTGSPELMFTDIVTDSRQLSYTEGQAFIAIRGKNHDGHQFVDTLYGKGIRIFVVERLPENPGKYHDAAFIEVSDSVEALHDLAAHKRKQFRSPVIAVTGSAGKTVVKEWLADIIGLALPVIRSPRSYNSQIGVPLSVWKLSDKFRLGIFEAGISMPGEMEKLERIIRPDIGVITNIGDAHSENFAGTEAKAREKLKLFKETRTIIYDGDQEIIHRLLTGERKEKIRLVDWSFEREDAAIRVRRKNPAAAGTDIELTYLGHPYEFRIPFSDRASVENAITAVSACLALGISPDIISSGLSSLVSVAMRMEIRNGIRNCLLIEDYYNSDPGSLGMALDYLKTQSGRNTTLILSDFIQSGRDIKELYGEVADGIRRAGIKKFIGIGPELSSCSSLFSPGSTFFYSTEEFIHHFNPADFSGEAILLKGARRFEFEKIGKLLEQQVHQTMLEVSLDAISHNLNEFRRFLNPGTRIMAMVKAFAYGAGPSEIASLLEYHRVSWLGVAYADEGVKLREAGVALPVMVMNPDPSSLDAMIRYNLEPVIYSQSSLKRFVATASKNGLLHYPVHIEIDTGMHRLGFMPDEIDKLAVTFSSTESIRAATIFSHFAASEDPSLDSFSRKQARLFIDAAEKIRNKLGYPVLRHICNSAAIVRFPEYQFEMVRPGIGIYGAGSLDGLSLKPAGRFRTKISQVKRIPAGEPVGYGCNDTAGHERVIGIVPVGYADGLNRKLGNRNGEMLVRNRRVQIIGNICMDMCMIDISGTGAAEGDDVEIFGENIPIGELASKCQTIPYEILTSIPARVKRVFFRE